LICVICYLVLLPDVADGVPPAALETTDLFKDLPQTDGVKDATATGI